MVPTFIWQVLQTTYFLFNSAYSPQLENLSSGVIPISFAIGYYYIDSAFVIPKVMIDILLLCPEQYRLAHLVDSELTFSKFAFVDADGYWSMEELGAQTFDVVSKMFEFFFNGKNTFSKIYDNDGLHVYDLSAVKAHVISVEFLEAHYTNWLAQSNIENTMDQYGQLISAVGFIRRHEHWKNLIAVARKRV